MPLFDNIRKRIDQLTNKASELVGQRATMRACMLGPRAVGKTTVLTAIFHNTSESISQTKLNFEPTPDTLSRMNNCKRQLEQIFEQKISIEDRPSAGIESTAQVNVFNYAFGLKGKRTSVDLEIKDYPGEYVDGGLHAGEIDKFIEESHAVIIAIDTPHLMEQNGKYNDTKNKCRIICDYFKNNLKPDDEKLILLVPLKCEKYYYEKRMDQVNAAVKREYSDLLNQIKDIESITCAITPILTIGGVEFDAFETDGNGNILETPGGLPEKAQYKFYEANPTLRPMYCVQPLYYILSYVTHVYEDNKKKGNVFKTFCAGLFNLFSSDIDLYNEMSNVARFMLRSGNGFEIIQGEHNLSK